MSFGGPPPATLPPSGPFEETLTTIASSPYAIAAAMLLINLGGRFLSMEITKEQENFLSQPWFRRFIIFIIFFLATRNLITAAWLSLIVILCIGYLFNENSSLCIFGKGGVGTCKTKDASETIGLTPEEESILNSLQEKASKLIQPEEKPQETPQELLTSKVHKQYEKVMRGLWQQ
jgi:hypothetical protein